MDQRIYKITNNNEVYLVQANSQAQALRHIAGKHYTVEVAKAIDVAQLMSKGVKMEVALAPEQGQLEGV